MRCLGIFVRKFGGADLEIDTLCVCSLGFFFPGQSSNVLMLLLYLNHLSGSVQVDIAVLSLYFPELSSVSFIVSSSMKQICSLYISKIQ